MKRRAILIAGLVLVLTASVQAVTIPVPLPAIDVSATPSQPTPAQTFTLTLSGQWPDSCPPDNVNVQVVPGDSLWLDLLLPGADDCDEPVCNPVVSGYQMNTSIGPLPSGLYTIYARAVACNQSGAFERIGSIRVGTGTGGNGNGGPPISGFTVGERVVLLENRPFGLSDLLMGQAGTVVCVGATDCPGCILISWDAWESGRDDAARCRSGDQPVLSPPGSVMWVDPDVTLIGRHFNRCGIIRQGLEGCILLETDDREVFNLFGAGWLNTSLGQTGPIRFGDRVRVRGSLNTTRPDPDVIRICPQRDGDIYYPIITRCVPAGGDGCCSMNLRPGDRVVLLVDEPEGVDGRRAPNLRAQSRGTVVCCDASDPRYPVFVSWDDWREGTNDDTFCDPPSLTYPQNSGWWMRCSQIASLSGGQPGPCEDDGITITLGGRSIRLTGDPQCIDRTTFTGCTDVSLETNFRARLSARVTPEPGIGGNWEAWVTPEVVGPGDATVRVCVRVTNLDLSTVPPGKNVVANVAIFAVPAP